MREKIKNNLIVYATLIVPIMILLFAIVSNIFGKTIGYVVPYGIYLAILWYGIRKFKSKEKSIEKVQIKHNIILYILAFIPVVATFFVAFLPIVRLSTWISLLVTLIYAVVNGVLEERFWRYTFNNVYKNKVWLAYIIPTIIFSSWHIALLFAKGVSYNGGAIALVGGASFMGILWGYVMYRTKNIKIVTCAHVMVNFFAFSQLIQGNWVM